ncbi:hypothetical protein BaRGS_00012518, partial [Batillaria attramentaria]
GLSSLLSHVLTVRLNQPSRVLVSNTAAREHCVTCPLDFGLTNAVVELGRLSASASLYQRRRLVVLGANYGSEAKFSGKDAFWESQ